MTNAEECGHGLLVELRRSGTKPIVGIDEVVEVVGRGEGGIKFAGVDEENFGTR
jgi:hypothetical protein